MSGFDDLSLQLREREQAHLYRRRLTLESPQGAEVVIEGKKYLNFCSNDYLGLANHPQVVAAFQQAATEYGVGGGASHLVNGHSHYHYELELALAGFTGRPRALLFSTGYMANLGAVNALIGKSDAIFEDRLNHASLLDAGLLSKASFNRYRHADLEDLNRRLCASPAKRKLIVSDGLFSMDGDIAPVAELAALAKTQGAWLMIDDAHGIGCLGACGRGSLEVTAATNDDVQVLVGTLGKALGTAGAFVAGSAALIETLIQQARTYIYTTAQPPALAAATLASLRLVEAEAWRRTHLEELIHLFRSNAAQYGIRLLPSSSPIQPMLCSSSESALQASAQLKKQGILVSAIRPPTVPQGGARLRITLSAAHSKAQVQKLVHALAPLAEQQ